MTAINNNGTVLGLVLCITIFFSFTEGNPVNLKNKEVAPIQDDSHLQRNNSFGVVSPDPKSAETDAFKMALAQAALMANGRYPDVEMFFSDLDRFDTDALDPGKQPERNSSVDISSQLLSKNQHIFPIVEPLGKDDGVFSLELDFFWPESRNSVSLHDEKQADRNGASDFGDPPLQREQHALPNVEPIGNDNGAFGLERLFDFFWPQSETTELAIEEKQADQNIATQIDNQPLSREHHTAQIFESLNNDDGVFSLDREFELFLPPTEKANSIYDESQVKQNSAVNYLDLALLRGQRAAPHVEPRNNYVEVMDREMQDLWWPQPVKTGYGFKEEKADQDRVIYLADPSLLGGQESALEIKPRDTQEGEIETTPNPNKPTDITYESNMLYYFVTVTLPSFIGISLLILLCCFCMRINGCCCRLFDERPPDIIEEDAEELGEENRGFRKGQIV